MAEAEEADCTLSEYKDTYVLVRVQIPNLKSKSKGFFSKITGGRKDQAQNAEIEGDFQPRSFSLLVTGGAVKGMQNKKWTFSSKLTYPIDPSNSYWQVEEGFVHVYLKKADVGDDWLTCIRRGDL